MNATIFVYQITESREISSEAKISWISVNGIASISSSPNGDPSLKRIQ